MFVIKHRHVDIEAIEATKNASFFCWTGGTLRDAKRIAEKKIRFERHF